MSRPALVMLSLAGVLALATWQLSTPRERVEATAGVDRPAASSVPPVRVLLGEPRAEIALRIDGPYRALVDGDWRVLAQGSQLAETTVRLEGERIKLGDREFAARQIDLHALAPGTLSIDGRRYAGHVRLVRFGGDRVAAINLVELEEYVAGVLDAEMPRSFPAEARAAQAIAARTFALAQMKLTDGASDFDLRDGTSSQVYRGLVDESAADGDAAATQGQQEIPSSKSIVERTRGLVLTYQGRLFTSYYSAVCGGSTLDGRRVFARAAPPLVGIACDHCRDAPRYRWETTLQRDDIAERAAHWSSERGRPLGELERIEVLAPSEGLLATVRLVGSERASELSAHEFRQQIAGADALLSSAFELEAIDEGWRARGRGWGHRVGLCQWGARQLAADGRGFEEILSFYYPGAELTAVR